MVTRHGALAFGLLLLACAPREGTVLVAREHEQDARTNDEGGPEADAAADADVAAAVDAGAGSGIDTRGRCRIGGSKDGFYEDFAESALDSTRWLVAHGPIEFAGQHAQGGFAYDNVSHEAGVLTLRVRGDQYEGSVRSVDRDGRPLATGKRSAAAIVTRDLFASGTYQVQGRFVAPSGVEVALWLRRDDDGEGALNLATPGLSGSTASYAFVRMQSRDASGASASTDFALAESLDDRASHILRFDWYTTADNAAVFWVDDVRRVQFKENLPSRRAARLWIVAWLKDATPAPFDTAEVRIESAFVTPFGNDGDACSDGELEGPFLALP